MKQLATGALTVKASGTTAWALGGQGQVLRVDDDSDTPTTFTPLDEAVVGNATHVGVHDEHAYVGTWLGAGSNARIGHLSTPEKGLEPLVSTPCKSGLDGVAASSTFVYFFCAEDDGIYRAALP